MTEFYYNKVNMAKKTEQLAQEFIQNEKTSQNDEKM